MGHPGASLHQLQHEWEGKLTWGKLEAALTSHQRPSVPTSVDGQCSWVLLRLLHHITHFLRGGYKTAAGFTCTEHSPLPGEFSVGLCKQDLAPLHCLNSTKGSDHRRESGPTFVRHFEFSRSYINTSGMCVCCACVFKYGWKGRI